MRGKGWSTVVDNLENEVNGLRLAQNHIPDLTVIGSSLVGGRGRRHQKYHIWAYLGGVKGVKNFEKLKIEIDCSGHC